MQYETTPEPGQNWCENGMSRTSHPDGHEAKLTDLPVFELDYLVDDIENPSKVMIVPDWDNESGLSSWLTIDIEHAVPLKDVQ